MDYINVMLFINIENINYIIENFKCINLLFK